ncbi:acetylcholine receptor subunit beta-like [Mizuhopecten yessoensis]|uniref:acetylcholine receptor subunit beta-like n=1 Tax=Mizuhopecten yessoensis TaxID=6573 RepID=UPI000B45E378|nr:acetylcholine receptor subunit beta-like [Mizuhopecten yessoensis]
MLSIREYEEKTGKLTIVGIFIFEWQDTNMRWDPSVYGGIPSFLIPQSEVWKPEIVNAKPYEKREPLGFDRVSVRVLADGKMLWMPGDVYQTTCSADVTYFPFDVHQCKYVFSPWMYLLGELILQPTFDEMDLELFTPSGLWELKGTEIAVDSVLGGHLLFLIITFKRRPTFHIVNILAPISVMGLLNVMVFLLPAESGERVGFSITVLLAMSVFLTIISDSLPSTSQPSIPRISYLLLGDLVIGTVITICTILVLRLHHKRDDEDVPRWLRCMSCTKCCSKSKREMRRRSNCDASSETFSNLCADGFYSQPIDNVSSTQDNRRLYQGRINKTGHVQCRSGHRMETWDNHYQQDLNIPRDDTIGGHPSDDRSRQESQNSSSEPHSIVKWKNVADFFDVLFFLFFLVLIIAKNIVSVLVFIGNI